MQKRKRNITIVDIAKQTGVSIATISRIINGGTGFSQETEQKVWNVIHELGYEPNKQARVMRQGKTPDQVKNHLIMRVFYNYNSAITEDYVCPNYACVESYFNFLAQSKGLFSTTYYYKSLEEFRCPLLLDKIVDGAIVSGPYKEVVEYVSRKIPTVLMDVGPSPLFPELIRVNNAMGDGISLLLEQAYQLGHRNAAVVGAQDHRDYFSRNHCSIICRELNERGFTLSPEHCYRPEGLNPENHDEQMHRIAEALIPEIRSGKISLIFCEDHSYAKSIYKELTSAGIKIPEEVSLLSLNTRYLIAPDWNITSVTINWKALMGTAIDVLQDLIAGKQTDCRFFLIQPDIFQGKTLAEPNLRS